VGSPDEPVVVVVGGGVVVVGAGVLVVGGAGVLVVACDPLELLPADVREWPYAFPLPFPWLELSEPPAVLLLRPPPWLVVPLLDEPEDGERPAELLGEPELQLLAPELLG
jgi:hypothetical protein